MRKFLLLLFLFACINAGADTLDTLTVTYCDLQGHTQHGSIICNHRISAKLTRIFDKLYKAGYKIERICPISEYDNDDERSMTANNTSCYCYRNISGSKKLSMHARGLAIDLNPLYNPCIRKRTGVVQPKAGRKYANNRKQDSSLPVTKIDHSDLAYKLFKAEGFTWGGDWSSTKDYQHFEYNK